MDEVLNLLLGPFGTLVLSLVILFGGWKRWWVFGWHYEAVIVRESEWKEIAMRALTNAESGTKIAETVVTLKANGLT